MYMADGSVGTSVIRRLLNSTRSTGAAPADPDDPQVQGFAEFGLPAGSPLAVDDQLRELEEWRDTLQIPAPAFPSTSVALVPHGL
jgi:hypothetical protein